MDGKDKTGRERKERLRARRDAAGIAQVSGWVPKERRAYAREVLAALARGTNTLPPDPEQAAALDVARAETTAARMAETEARTALAEAEQHGRELTAELNAVRTQGEAAREAGYQVEAAATARAEAAEQAQRALKEELQMARNATTDAQAVIDRIQKTSGLRGKLVAFLIRKITQKY